MHITCSHIDFCYPGTRVPVLRDLCLSLNTPGFHALFGPSGVGKTSLAKLLSAPPEPLAKSVEDLRRLFEQNQEVARDRQRAVVDRTAAVELLAYQPLAEVSATFEELLSNDQD